MSNAEVKKLVILCGGTGGHFYPGLTIARELNKSGGKAYIFIGGHVDKIKTQSATAEKYDIKVFTVNSAKLSKNPIKFAKFILSLLGNTIKAIAILRKLRPDAILGMGSFTSLPASLAAIILKIPLFLHDGNAVTGKANLFLSRWARITMSAFPPVNAEKIRSKSIYSGMPIRPELSTELKTKEEAIAKINEIYKSNLNPDMKTIFVFGGSQGAATINSVLPEAIRKMERKNIQVIHLFGKVQTFNPYKHFLENALILKSCNKMHLLYSAADVIVSRCGGSTVAELLFFQKPAILIPYPLHRDLQQKYNAEFYLKSSKSKILLNENCTAENVSNLLATLLINSNCTGKTMYNDRIIAHAAENILQIIGSELN